MGAKVIKVAMGMALAAGGAVAGWQMEGSFSPSYFYHVHSVEVAPDGTVYTATPHDTMMRYFTSTGSLLGSWRMDYLGFNG